VSRLDRRTFLGTSAAALAGASLQGCASFVATPVTPENGVIRLPIRNYPQLEQPGGYLRIRPGGEATLYVLALDDGGFAVLSPICTHLQCTVNVDGSQLLCPCHGSTYDRTGRVLRGPAERPLQRFDARLGADGMLVITYQEGA
jgi:cytochrome b6-f complex iron-sulfur subunit